MKRGRGGGGLDAIENRRIRKERGRLRSAAPFGLVFRVVLVAVSRRVLGCGARQRGALVYAKHTPRCQNLFCNFIISNFFCLFNKLAIIQQRGNQYYED